ncbi:hypothetical protein NQZ68_007178 [Dissostichus eleginoides]|nr:hypothetical protein NQZ68_007178 [Dissostichus eleginoides]
MRHLDWGFDGVSQSLCPPFCTYAHHNNLYGSLDLLAAQGLPAPPPFHAPLHSPTSGVGQSPGLPRERL